MTTRIALRASLLIGLVSSPSRAMTSGELIGWGNDTFGHTDVPARNDFVAISTGAFHGLCQVLHKRGKLEEAVSGYREAMAIEKKEAIPDAVDLPTYLTELSRILAAQNKLTEARQRAEEAIDICKRYPAHVYPKYRNGTAAALREVTDKIAVCALDSNASKTNGPEPKKDAAH